ncbi:unnamed protein product [Linum tenue]|uniref:Reverse transcriptase zinc-binding domain-containing protein n=1 Tax=Linum tenue TaxID=586396 RepID=A0AAV0PP84_9ROSI|nr:unnamed protein product [Linum tenue]
MRWCIGNGADVRIWGDRWLPGGLPDFVPLAPRGLPVDSNVRQLIDPVTERWNWETIEECMPAEVGQRILQIPLRGNGERDSLIWSASASGEYIVKEGYKYWLDNFLRERAMTPVGDAAIWKYLWSMKIPPKIKHFMWRFMRGILPAGDKISTKSTKWSDKCPFCDSRETQVHFFGDCGWTSRIRTTEDCYRWTVEAMAGRDKEDVEAWCIVLWFLWRERNAQLFNGKKMTEQEIIPRAQAFLSDYRSQQAGVMIQGEARGNVKWCAPDPRRIKINTDAAILQGDGIVLGMVARDSQGQFLMAASMKIPGRWEVEAAEARAAEFGVQIVQQHHLMNLVIEVDSLGLV